MSFKIAIASGKGGTGKTSVSISLFKQLIDKLGGKIQLVDCDVEEPNDLIFFNDPIKLGEFDITQLIPTIDKNQCTFCRKCSDYCEFNAIVVIPHVKYAEVNSSLCHSCGACSEACEDGAISESPESIGKINIYKSYKGNELAEGRLRVGSAMQTMLIKELKKRIPTNNEIVIYDAPPGTSCQVVETISDTDYIILVAEPTLFGLHDLKLMVKLIKELEIPFGVIINKAGLGDHSIYKYLVSENIELLGEIPFNREFAALYADGKITEEIPEIIKDSYIKILNSLDNIIMQNEGDYYFKW